MQNMTAAERLSEALARLLKRIYDHCQKVLVSPLKMGACLVSPRFSGVPLPTSSIHAELEDHARQYFEPLGVVGFYFQYWTPPLLPVSEMPRTNGVDDYLAVYEIPEFDDAWQQSMLARSLIFCPNESEFDKVEGWFVPQIDAIRFTPILHQEIQELKEIEKIRKSLAQHPLPFFEEFIVDYMKRDPNIRHLDKKSWRGLYPEVSSFFEKDHATIHEAYTASRKKAVQTRNQKIKMLLQSFAACVQAKLIWSASLSDEIKHSLTAQLQDDHVKRNARYRAARPRISLSDIECGQFLYLLMVEFGKAPKKKKTLGEIILFVCLCQHVAFSDLEFTIDGILDARITDIDLNNLTIKVKESKIVISRGYAEMLSAWIGPDERENRRKLFPSLTYDNLEKQIGKISKGFWGPEGKLITSDFLAKVHVVPNVRITMELRQRINQQMLVLRDSPYKIDSQEIKKHILEAFAR